MAFKFNWKVFIITLFGVYLLGIFSSFSTAEEINSNWFNTIKPQIAPPNWFFGLILNFVYVFIALYFVFVWQASRKRDKKVLLTLLGINLLFNSVWTLIFFIFKNPLFAFADIALVFFTISFMLTYSWNIHKRASFFLLPYLFWVILVGIMNYLIVVRF